MHRIDSATFADDVNGVGKDGFTEGDAGMGVAPTQLTAAFFNDVQEELCNFITGQQITLVKGTQTQLLAALRTPRGEASTPAITAYAGTGNTHGIISTASGTGVGLKGVGSSTAGSYGVWAVAAGTNNTAILATGTGTGHGISTTGGSNGGHGLDGQGGAAAGSGVKGTGGASDGDGLTGIGGASNGIGVVGRGTGTGAGGSFTGANDGGYGAIVAADTTSPTKAALRVVPQNADPTTSPAAGDAYVHTSTGKMSVYDGTAWARLPGLVKSVVADESRTSTGDYTTFKYTLPANSVRVGSRIRIKVFGLVSSYTSGDVTMQLYHGGTTDAVAGTNTVTPANNWRFLLETEILVVSTGAGGTMIFGGTSMIGIAGGAGADVCLAVPATVTAVPLDTTAANDFILHAIISGTATVKAIGMLVDVS